MGNLDFFRSDFRLHQHFFRFETGLIGSVANQGNQESRLMGFNGYELRLVVGPDTTGQAGSQHNQGQREDQQFFHGNYSFSFLLI